MATLPRESRVRSCRLGLCLSALLVVSASAAESPAEPSAPDWRPIGALIDDTRLDEAFRRLSEIDAYGLDAEGHERSAGLFRRVASLAREAQRNRLAVQALIALAHSETELARYRAAKATLEQAEALWRQDPDPATGVDLWSAHAVRLTYQGDPSAAMEYSFRALELARQQGDPARVRRLLVNRGQSQLQLHDYTAALDSFNEALSLEVEDARRIITLASLGIAYFELNQFDQAERIFERAREMAAESGNRRLEAWAIGELGTTFAHQRRTTARALALLDQSIALFADLGDVRNETIFLGNRARLLSDLGRHEEALAGQLETERRLGEIEAQRPNPIVTKNIGDCLVALERFDEAETRYRQAIGEATADGNQKAHWQAAWGLARVHRRLGRIAEADAAYQEALAVIETLRGTLRLESFKTDFLENKMEVYESYVDFLLADAHSLDHVERAFGVAERARARAFLDTLAETRGNLHETLPRDILDAEDAMLGAIAEIQSRIQREGPSSGSRQELEAAEAELEALYLRVRREIPRFRDIRYPQPAKLAAVQQALNPSEYLVEYFLAEPRSHVWIVTRERIEWLPLPARAEIDEAVRAAYGSMVDPAREPDGLAGLADWLLSPLADIIEPGVSLLIVPSGSLYYLPLDLLPDGEHGGSLADVAATTYLPSASALVELRGGALPVPAARLLAVGDPAYPAADSPEPSHGQRAPAGRLPHTGTEVTQLAIRFGAGHATVLRGAEATEARFKREAQAGFSVVHIATHGRVDTDHPERSALLFADPPGSGQDGLLQIREIYRLPLAVDLVTLSACRTAMGELATGEGMVGLTRAFHYAGAPSIVASLWNVDDEATAVFMDRFYGQLERGASKAEALRRARLDLKGSARHGHPYYWAAYVLVGEGSDGVTFPSRRWVPQAWALVAVGVLIAAGLGWLGLRRRH